MSTHNICFRGVIRKMLWWILIISRHTIHLHDISDKLPVHDVSWLCVLFRYFDGTLMVPG